jgi:hypothetical protein
MFWRRRTKSKTAKPNGKDVFLGLRNQLMAGDAASFGIAPSKRFPRVWGVLFEQGMGDAVATVVSLADGTTSLYTSTGGGVVGGGDRPGVAEATERFLDAVETSLDLTTPIDTLPLPEPEEVRFNVLTFDGPRTVSARRAELGDHSHPLQPLFNAGHEVITQLRLLSETSDAAEGTKP